MSGEALIKAANRGDTERVKALLSDSRMTRAMVNQQDLDGRTALFVACREGHNSIVEQLLSDSRVEVNQAINNGATPLYIACAQGHDSVVSQLLSDPRVEVNQARNDGATPLYAACTKGHNSVVSQLLFDPRVEVNLSKDGGFTPLFIACQNGHDSVVSQLLSDPRVEVNQTMNEGATPLFMACQNGHDSVVIQLLSDPRVEVNQAMNDGATPLYIACGKGHDSVVSQLLSDPRVEVNQADNEDTTPLFIACQESHDSVVSQLLSDPRVEVNLARDSGATPLYIACLRGHDSVVSQLLSDPRVEVNQAMNEGATPLAAACQKGHDSVVRQLLSCGADATIPWQSRSRGALSPLKMAKQRDHTSIVRLLKIHLSRYPSGIGPVTMTRKAPSFRSPVSASSELSPIEKLLAEAHTLSGTHPRQAIEKCDAALLIVPDHLTARRLKGKYLLHMVQAASTKVQQRRFLMMAQEPLQFCFDQDPFDEAVAQQLETIERLLSALDSREPISPIRSASPVSPAAPVSPAMMGLRELKETDIVYEKDIDGEPLRIGSGGFGEVFKGKSLGVDVAVKRLHLGRISDRDQALFKQEAELHASIHHPNIVTLMGIIISASRLSMVMEYMPGGSLYSQLHNESALPWSTRFKVAKGILAGLVCLHSYRIVHRDLKSMNVLMDGPSKAKLCDFGLAKIKTDATTASASRGIIGTPAWMSPEAFDSGKITTKSDVYTLGVVLWEISSRKHPYDGLSMVAVATRIGMGKTPEIPEGTPEEFASVMKDCWKLNPDERPTVESLLPRLNALGESSTARPFASRSGAGAGAGAGAGGPSSTASGPSYLGMSSMRG